MCVVSPSDGSLQLFSPLTAPSTQSQRKENLLATICTEFAFSSSPVPVGGDTRKDHTTPLKWRSVEAKEEHATPLRGYYATPHTRDIDKENISRTHFSTYTPDQSLHVRVSAKKLKEIKSPFSLDRANHLDAKTIATHSSAPPPKFELDHESPLYSLSTAPLSKPVGQLLDPEGTKLASNQWEQPFQSAPPSKRGCNIIGCTLVCVVLLNCCVINNNIFRIPYHIHTSH